MCTDAPGVTYPRIQVFAKRSRPETRTLHPY